MSDRKAHWENVYKDKSALEVSWYQSEPRLSLQLIHSAELASDAAIIDVGGGASVLTDHLCDEGFSNTAVLDISANALACAKQRLGDKAEDVEWFDEDRAVFHFLTGGADRRSYVEVLTRALAPNGHVIIAAFAIGGPEKCSGLDIVQYDAEKLQAELGDAFELLEEVSEIHLTPSGAEQQFSYFRFMKK